MIVIGDAIDADALRIRHEFLAMPGLVLTVAQTARLHALSTARARILLETAFGPDAGFPAVAARTADRAAQDRRNGAVV